MSEMKFTPGPWEANGEAVDAENNSVYNIAICHEANIPRSWSGTDYATKTCQLANARLIAAAPELLEALQSALAVIDDYLDYGHDGDPWKEDARLMGEMDINYYERDGRLESARAAIIKATKGAE